MWHKGAVQPTHTQQQQRCFRECCSGQGALLQCRGCQQWQRQQLNHGIHYSTLYALTPSYPSLSCLTPAPSLLSPQAVRFMSSSEDEELPRRYRKGVKWTPREQSFPTGQKGQAKHPLVEGDRERRHRQLPRRYLDSSYSILPTESESELSEGYPELAPEE